MIRLLMAANVAIALAVTPARARDKVLEPSSEWVLDYAEEQCSLFRLFGEGGDQIHLQIDSFGNPTAYRLTLAGDLIFPSRRMEGEISYRLTPDEPLRTLHVYHGFAGNVRSVATSAFSFGPPPPSDAEDSIFRVSDEDMEAYWAKIRSMEVVFDRGRERVLQIGELAGPLYALRSCVDDLHRSWGIDPERQRTLTRPPIPDPEALESVSRFYPEEMLRKGMGAFMPMRAKIAADGSIVDCVVQEADKDDAFERAACELLENTFKPALDEHSDPVEAMFHTVLIFGGTK